MSARWKIFGVGGLLGCLFAAGCVAEVRPLVLVVGRLEAPAVVELGIVQVGDPQSRRFVLTNPGPGPVYVSEANLVPSGSAATHRFSVELTPQWLRPGEMAEAVVHFEALGETNGEVEAQLILQTDTEDPDQPGTKQEAVVRLLATGVRYGIEVSPEPVDYGVVPSGAIRSVSVQLTNRLDRKLTVRAPDRAGERVRLFVEADEGQFTVVGAVRADGAFPLGRAELDAGETITVEVRFEPPTVSLGGISEGIWRVAGCEAEECAQPVRLIAETVNDALVCRPEVVDFGAVYPDQERPMPISCINRSPVTLRLVSASMTPGSDGELSVDEAPIAPWPAGTSIQLQGWFRPTQLTLQRGGPSMGTLQIDAEDPASGARGSTQVQMIGQAGGARLEVLPNPLDFGEVAIDTQRTQSLTLVNVGFDTLEIYAVQVDTAGTGRFSAGSQAVQLAPGATLEWPVTFAPTAAGTVTSGIRFVTNDAVTPEHEVGLTGIGLFIPVCMYGVNPPSLQFGAVRLGSQAIQQITVRNVGPDDCLLRDFRIEPAAGTSSVAFSLPDGIQPPTRLTPGQGFTVRVAFSPDRAAELRAWLTFYVSDPQASNPRVPLFGVGRPLIEVECPASVVTPAGQPITLTALANSVGTVTGYDWAIVSAPMGGIGTPDQWTPAPPTAETEVFLPFIVGVYEIQISVTDDQGNQAACTTQVTAEGRGLRVTMTWNGSGDVDLHLHKGTVSRWFSADDCYYANRAPSWDGNWPTSDGPNPELDFDNTTANGPENTRINVVEIGESYTVGAHNFARAQGRQVTIQIYCGGGTVPDATYTSRPMMGTDSGNCSGNDFWKSATVVFDTVSTCRITHLDQYVRSQDACNAF